MRDIVMLLFLQTIIFLSLITYAEESKNIEELREVNGIKKLQSDDLKSQEASTQLEPITLRLIGKERLSIDLPTAIRIASSSNLDIAEAKAQVIEASGNSNAAFGGLIPSLSLFFGYGYTDGDVQGTFGEVRDATFETFNPGLIATYFLNPGEAIFNLIAAHRIVDVTRADESAITQDVLLSVVENYYDLLEAQGMVNVAEKAVSDAMTLVKIAEILEKQGIGPGADVVRAKTQLASKKQVLIRAQQEFRENSANLALTLKLDSSVTLFPGDNQLTQIHYVDRASKLDELIDSALKKHPEILSANIQQEAADAEVSGAWLGAFGPEVLLEAEVGGIGDQFGDIGGREIYQAVVGISLTASSYGEIKATRAKFRRAQIVTERVREGLSAEVVKAYDEVLSADEEITPARMELESAEESLRLSQVRFKRGLGLAVEVIQAGDALANARLNYIRSIIGYNKAQVRLLNAIGEIRVENLVGVRQ
ncbi:TolC family protein [Desulfobacterota bacterium AH_259_B03_O07]|nr:TolC family protein [Desulfobacterota bacterium AH_259_B03_O07]